MRDGVHNIQEGSKKLMLMISSLVEDQRILDTISRYARASLYIIFMASSCEKHEHPRLKAVEIGLLTKEEADKLAECNAHRPYHQAEALWVWLGNAVTRLHDKGLSKGPPHYCALMAAVEM